MMRERMKTRLKRSRVKNVVDLVKKLPRCLDPLTRVLPSKTNPYGILRSEKTENKRECEIKG